MQPASAGSEIWGPVTCHVFLKRCMYIYRDFIDLILLCGRSGSQMSLLSQQYLKTCAACLNQTKLYDPLQIRLVGGNPTHPRHAKYLSLESCVYLSRKQRYHASNSHMIPRIALYGVPTWRLLPCPRFEKAQIHQSPLEFGFIQLLTINSIASMVSKWIIMIESQTTSK